MYKAFQYLSPSDHVCDLHQRWRRKGKVERSITALKSSNRDKKGKHISLEKLAAWKKSHEISDCSKPKNKTNLLKTIMSGQHAQLIFAKYFHINYNFKYVYVFIFWQKQHDYLSN